MNKKKTVLIILGFLITLSFILFVQSPYWVALTKSKSHFIKSSNSRVLYEQGAEKYASIIADFLPAAINHVETIHGLPFKEYFKVYVCNSQKSLGEFVAAKSLYPIRGLVLRGDIYMAPSAFNFKGIDTHKETIMHKLLSHLHFRQRLGFVKDRKIPTWFSEGFADYVSGAGGEGISDRSAVDYIMNGQHFIPNDKSKVFGSWHRETKGLSGPMYHKQVKMFVTFIADSSPLNFNDLIIEIQNGKSFKKSFNNSMGNTTHYYWNLFVSSIE